MYPFDINDTTSDIWNLYLISIDGYVEFRYHRENVDASKI